MRRVVTDNVLTMVIGRSVAHGMRIVCQLVVSSTVRCISVGLRNVLVNVSFRYSVISTLNLPNTSRFWNARIRYRNRKLVSKQSCVCEAKSTDYQPARQRVRIPMGRIGSIKHKSLLGDGVYCTRKAPEVHKSG